VTIDGVDVGAHASRHESGGADQVHSIADDDDDTKIQVEESADEDHIRMDVAGTEAFLLDNNGILALAKQAGARAYRDTTDQLFPNTTFCCISFNTEHYDTQNEFDSSVKSGAADATEANKLHDADGGFAAGDVGKRVWNKTDNTYTTVSGFVDSGELDLTDDIMVDTETYELYASKYTATVAGQAVITAHATLASLADGKTLIIIIKKNGLDMARSYSIAGATGIIAAFVGTVLELAANDYIEILLHHSHGSDATLMKTRIRNNVAIQKIA